MKIYFSDFFEVDPARLEEYGAFNVSLINDLPLFIDPFLLFNAEKPEYQRLHQEIITYVRFLRDMSLEEGISPGLLQGWFRFPEVRQNWLGYSRSGNRGSGLGKDFARSLNENLRTVFSNFGSEVVTSSSHLEKLCLIRDGIGRDNISDFTTNIIKAFLLRYTEAFAVKHVAEARRKKVAVRKVSFNYDTKTWDCRTFDLPYHVDDYVILTPKDLLTKDETWINKGDLVHSFDEVAGSVPNEQLRSEINFYFLQLLAGDHTKEAEQQAVSRVVERFPEILDYYIKRKEEDGPRAKAVSSEKVAETERLFIEQLEQFAKKLLNETGFYQSPGDTYTEAYSRVLFLKHVIEDNDGYRFFYIDGKPVQRESDLQILFRLTWFASHSDANREVNNGRGPVDWKISRGSKDKTLVEFKLASNSQLKRNLEKQVPVYEKANDTQSSIKVVMFFTEAEREKMARILKELKLEGDRNIVLIDACSHNKPPGSKA